MTWNKDRKQTKYGHKRREHMTTQQNPDINSPSWSSSSLTVPSGGGVGALEAPQDKYGQEHRTETSRVEQTDRDHGGAGKIWKTWWSWELRRPWRSWSSRGHDRWSSGALPLSPRPGPYSRNSIPPPKFPWGSEGGIRSPPWLNRQDSTKQDSNALQGQTDRTGQPQELLTPPRQGGRAG